MDKRNNRIDVMISEAVRGKMPQNASKEDWARFNSSFVRCETTARELAISIWHGYAFAPVYDGRRKKENFVGAWHIALDFDTGDSNSSLATLANDEFADCFASFAYSTPSSTPAQPRARIVFVFPYDDAIDNAREYEELYQALLWRYPYADKATKDAVRLFYGSEKCEVWPNWSVLPSPARQVCIEQYREHLAEIAPPPPVAVIRNPGGNYDRYVEKALKNAADRIARAVKGERHNKVWSAGLLLGELCAASWAGITDIEAEKARLVSAAAWAGNHKGVQEVERVLNDAVERGEQNPRPEPERRVPSPWELLPSYQK